jgi:hypothetical protein
MGSTMVWVIVLNTIIGPVSAGFHIKRVGPKIAGILAAARNSGRLEDGMYPSSLTIVVSIRKGAVQLRRSSTRSSDSMGGVPTCHIGNNGIGQNQEVS